MSRFWGSGKFPYTNINNLNLDWMIKLVLELRDQVAAIVGELGEVYVKPETGIPKSDLSAGVQTSLNKADTALQNIPSSYRTAADQDLIDGAQDAKINPLYNPLSLSGAQISFDAQADIIPEQFIINVLPIQSGSGAPSPTNTRQLASRSEISFIHNGNTITIPLLSAAPSYGGNLDLLSGVYGDYGHLVNFSDLRWGISDGFFSASLPDRIKQVGETFMFCSNYEYLGAGDTTWISNNIEEYQIAAQIYTTRVAIKDSRFDNVEDFLAANANTQLLYRVAPIEHKLVITDAMPVSGSNVYSTTVGTFSAIVNQYLKALNTAIGRAAKSDFISSTEGDTVSRAYNINDFVIYKNQLCKVTAPIQSGGTIQIGVNAVITTLGVEISALLNS